MIVEGPLGSAAISSGTTRERQTEPTGSERFGEILRSGGQVLLQGAQAALQTLPGGEVLCAALREGAQAARGGVEGSGNGSNPAAPDAGGSSSTGDGSGDLWEMTQRSQEFNLMYLQLQEDLSRENRRFSAMSNVLKTRHETARSVISNI